METIAKAALNTGKHWSRTAANPEQAKQALDMGARLLFQNAGSVIVSQERTGVDARAVRSAGLHV